jgi:hypothetical protein
MDDCTTNTESEGTSLHSELESIEEELERIERQAGTDDIEVDIEATLASYGHFGTVKIVLTYEI